jgi:hypothetical protein
LEGAWADKIKGRIKYTRNFVNLSNWINPSITFSENFKISTDLIAESADQDQMA